MNWKSQAMLSPGDVVTAWLMGTVQAKRRPAVVVSSDIYHATRPDIIIAMLTTQIAHAVAPTDYILHDWSAAGLRQPSALRVYLYTVLPVKASLIGHLTDRDWQQVQARLRLGLAVT
jgi:mRNA interferase MazF